jgi:uncharacterized protein (DUF58 family)
MPSFRRFPFLSEARTAGERWLTAWARRRQGEDATPLTLRSRRLYILPTRAGLAAGVLLLLMLLAGLNYNNSLALMLCFLLAGFTTVSMHQCHRMLAGLRVHRADVESTFAHQLGIITLQLDNEDSRARQGLMLRCPPCERQRFELAATSVRSVDLPYQAGRRGRQRIERLELASNAPLALFRAWAWLYLPLEVIVYPTPQGERALPPPRGQRRRAGEQRVRVGGEEEWASLRSYREGDSPRRVAWKAYARGAPLMVAHYDAPAGVHRLLDAALLSELPLEARLSQLAQWVLECERLGDNYGLRLGNLELPPRHGPAQRRACLEALALYGL